MKKTLILFLFFVLGFLQRSFCQHNDWCWGVNSLGNGRTYSYDIHADNFGNVYITGGTSNMLIVGNDTVYDIQTINNSDVFIAKYDSSGNALWVKKSENSNGYGLGMGVITDIDGNIFVAGYFSGASITFDTITLTNAGGNCSGQLCEELFIAKYDSEGNVIWAKSAWGLGEDHAEAIDCDIDGNIIITGYFESPHIIFDNLTLYNADSTSNYSHQKIFIAKYNTDGSIIWLKGAGGSAYSYDHGSAVETDNYGNLYLTGSFNSHVISFDSVELVNSTTLLNEYYNDVFIVKYDSAGNVKWAKKTGGNYGDNGNGIVIDNNGNIYLVGSFESYFIPFGADTLINNGSSDAFVCKYDSSGNPLWAKSAGVYSYTTGNSIALDTLNNVFISGGFCYGSFDQDPISFGSTILPYPDGGYYPSFIAMYNTEGDFIHAATLRTSGGVRNDVASNSLNQLYFGGGYGGINCSAFYLGNDTLSCPAIDNGFFLIGRYDCSSICPDDTVIITSINDTLYSSEAYSYQWFMDGVVINDAANQYYFPEEYGNYYVLVADASGCTYVSNILSFVGIEEKNKESFLIYPNPASNYLQIEYGGDWKDATVSIYNAVEQTTPCPLLEQGGERVVDVTRLPSGIYFLSLQSPQGSATSKFVRE